MTLDFIEDLLPGLERHRIPSGTPVGDWTIPLEWNLVDASVQDATGADLISSEDCNLHVVGYSEPVDLWLTREELEPHLHSLPDQPDAIPYVTSYYERDWGFCLTERQRVSLGDGPFRVRIDSSLAPGFLEYGELVIPGDSESEVLLSTYICHPSMANNELSGPVLACALGKWIRSLPQRRYSYRIVFLPETIGAIAYIHRNLRDLQANVVAGWVLTCVGDERSYSYLPSRTGRTLADRVSLAAFQQLGLSPVNYSFLDRGSDERQYCAPGVDLPVCSLMRSKYGEYPEYHTSRDDLTLISPAGLQGSFDLYSVALEALENNRTYLASTICEPQLSKRGLYPTLSTLDSDDQVRGMLNVWAFCDGRSDTLEIARMIHLPIQEVQNWCRVLEAAGVVREIPVPKSSSPGV